MNTWSKRIVAGVLTLAFTLSGSAFAATYDMGTLSPGGYAWSGLLSRSGQFSDQFDFTLATGGSVSPAAVYFDFSSFTPPNGFSSLSLTYDTQTFDLLTAGSGNPVSIGSLPSGAYSFTVAGDTLSGGGTYGVQTTVSAVPEPNVAALMLLGLGMVGFTLRARSRRDNRTRM